MSCSRPKVQDFSPAAVLDAALWTDKFWKGSRADFTRGHRSNGPQNREARPGDIRWFHSWSAPMCLLSGGPR